MLAGPMQPRSLKPFLLRQPPSRRPTPPAPWPDACAAASRRTAAARPPRSQPQSQPHSAPVPVAPRRRSCRRRGSFALPRRCPWTRARTKSSSRSPCSADSDLPPDAAKHASAAAHRRTVSALCIADSPPHTSTGSLSLSLSLSFSFFVFRFSPCVSCLDIHFSIRLCLFRRFFFRSFSLPFRFGFGSSSSARRSFFSWTRSAKRRRRPSFSCACGRHGSSRSSFVFYFPYFLSILIPFLPFCLIYLHPRFLVFLVCSFVLVSTQLF